MTRVVASLVVLAVLVAFVGILTFVFPLGIGLLLGFFVILTFAFPISVETYQKGWSNNLVMRNVEVVADSRALKWGVALAAIISLALFIASSPWFWILARIVFGG